MSTDMTPSTANALTSADDLQALGRQMAAQTAAAPIADTNDVPFLRLLKSGQWVYGQDSVEVEEGSEWAVNPASLYHGYVAWTDDAQPTTEVLAERMVRYGVEELPSAAELGPPPSGSRGWQKQLAVQLQCLTGEDRGQQVLYKGTSHGLKKLFAQKLIPAITQRLLERADPVAVVTLEAESYKHKKYGLVYSPIFQIARWASMNAATPAAETDEMDEPEDGEPPFEAEPEQPRRRRQRRAA